MLGSKGLSLFKVLKFMKKLSTKLWVWHNQHICYISKKVDVVTYSYHMETKGLERNGELYGKLCQMWKPSL